MKAALLAYLGLLEVDKAAFPGQVDVIGKVVGVSFSSVKAALLAYIGLLEVDKAAFLSLVDVLRENPSDKFFFTEIGFINVRRASRSQGFQF